MDPDPILATLADRARAFVASGAQPAVPRPAATVVLLRRGSAGPEVYLIRRAATMVFAAGMYAFPGGAVDPLDRNDPDVSGWAGPTPTEWARRLGLDESSARGVVRAAVREVFEESGILLATADVSAGTSRVEPGAGPSELEDARLAVIRRERSLTEVLATFGLVLRSDLLLPWARWITPEFEPRRYDTYFFVVAVPDGQVARDVSGEADLTTWVRPADAAPVTDPSHIALPMLPPTSVTLRELAAYPDLASIMAAAATRDAATAVRFRPDVIR
jgi:8-oxo-dGTP pyrophosphatase MutT (NUDIX family)